MDRDPPSSLHVLYCTAVALFLSVVLTKKGKHGWYPFQRRYFEFFFLSSILAVVVAVVAVVVMVVGAGAVANK